MKIKILLAACVAILFSCKSDEKQPQKTLNINGTWTLHSGQMITKGDTVNTYPVAGTSQEMIKIINDSHFAFFKHDLDHGKTKPAVFDAGAGTFTLSGDDYAEHLEYCSARDWENHDFAFKLVLKGDTLIQRGIEKIDSLNVNREIVETYIRKKGK